MGEISDKRFVKLSAKYEEAQKNISKQIDELTQNILNKLIDRIEVHQAEKTERGKVQKLVIYYNCTGSINLPEDSSH